MGALLCVAERWQPQLLLSWALEHFDLRVLPHIVSRQMHRRFPCSELHLDSGLPQLAVPRLAPVGDQTSAAAPVFWLEDQEHSCAPASLVSCFHFRRLC